MPQTNKLRTQMIRINTFVETKYSTVEFWWLKAVQQNLCKSLGFYLWKLMGLSEPINWRQRDLIYL